VPSRRLARTCRFHPTETKAEYLNELVLAGFQHIDAVSFVSPKHVKQMADSEEVMAKLNDSLPAGVERPEIIGIVVNDKGLERALATPGVSTIGYPYSISAYFRRANANMTREESRAMVATLKKETAAANRDLVIYISMAFGNPYDEPWGRSLCRTLWIGSKIFACVPFRWRTPWAPLRRNSSAIYSTK